MLYDITQNTVKLSILLFYLRIFPSDRFRFWTKALMIWISLRTISFFIAVCLQCNPVDAIWDLNVKGKCVNALALVFAGAGFSIAEDICIILLPIPCLQTLNLSFKRRLALIFMFALGSL